MTSLEPEPYDRIIFIIGKIKSIMKRNQLNTVDFADVLEALEDAKEKLSKTQREITEF